MRVQTLLSGSVLLASAAGWNTDVHNQVGFMAEKFLSPYTTLVLANILEPEYKGSIGRAAAWADAYAHTTEGHFSYQWHWVDSSDNPPQVCNIDYDRDCTKAGCVVSAIANQTDILKECIAAAKSGHLSGGTNLTCSYALKWVSHFIGDISQPLHASGLAAGGNLFNVTFGSKATELHAVWDGDIIYADSGVPQFSNTSLDPWMSGLVSRIRKDDFFEPIASWLDCAEPSPPVQCALTWARETNQWNCDYVYSHIINNTDLLTSGYAEGAYPIVELQLSKGALRLGTWLNNLVFSDYKPDRQVILRTNLSWADGPSKSA